MCFKQGPVVVTKHMDGGVVVGREVAASQLLADLSDRVLLTVSPVLQPGGRQLHLRRVTQRLPDGEGITIRCAQKTIDSLLERVGAVTAKSLATLGQKPETKTDGEENLDAEKAKGFRAGIGDLFLVCAERCDLQHATKKISRGVAAPAVQTWLVSAGLAATWQAPAKR